MGRLFGTDGVRGIVNKELTIDLAYKLGRFGAYVITEGKKDSKIVVGRDTRISGDMIESSLVAGILSAGCDVISLGVIPTPAIPKFIKKFDADAGVMISASHNPVEFNGIKFFNSDGFKLVDEVEDKIEDFILNEKDFEMENTAINLGVKKDIINAYKIYAEDVINTLDGDLSGINVAIDCANGAAYKVAKYTLEKLGASVEVINNKPTGLNINNDCGSTYPQVISEYVKNNPVDLGLSFDGDADRVIAVDENGEIVDGDKIMIICGKYLNENGKLKDNTIVSTVMSNLGFDIATKQNDMKYIKTKVGDRYVVEAMRNGNYSLGGEQSGHIIFLEHNTTGDGLLSGVQLINVMKNTGLKLSELAKVMNVYPQILLNAKVSNENKHKYLEDDDIVKAIEKIEEFYDGEGRVLIRPSGTEPLVRVMIEGKNQEELRVHASELVELIESKLA